MRRSQAKVSALARITDLKNRNSQLMDRLRSAESTLASWQVASNNAAGRARDGRQRIENLVRIAVAHTIVCSLDWDDAKIKLIVEQEALHICSAIANNFFPAQTGYTVPADFDKELRAMFTQQHYTKIAEVIRQQRTRIDSDKAMPHLDKEAEHHAISELQAALIKIFEKDNPKFQPFKFIEQASHHGVAVLP